MHGSNPSPAWAQIATLQWECCVGQISQILNNFKLLHIISTSRLSDSLEFRDDAGMGRRGRQPSSNLEFRGREIVLRGSTPCVYVASGAPERAIADSRGYVSIHRLVASEARGWWVGRGEAVRLVDGDPWNWSPANLRVVPLAAVLPKAQPGLRRRSAPRARRRRAPKAPRR